MSVNRFDRAVLKPLTQISEDGFLRAKAIVTRCGIFQYLNSDGTIKNELRHPDDVFDSASLESMKMLPVTNGHPTERLVKPENSRRLSVGYTGELIDTDGHHVLANFVVTDQQAIEEVFKNGKNQLSLGYQADLIDEDGMWQGVKYSSRQKNIRYNHLALVTSARAGDMAKIALDSSDAFEIETVNEETSTVAKKKIKLDGTEFEVEQVIADSFEKLQESLKTVNDEMSQIKKTLSKTEGERDSYKEKLEERNNKKDMEEEEEDDEKEKKSDKKTKNDAAIFSKLVKERVTLIDQASHIVDSKTREKFHDLENIDIMKAVISFKSKSVNLDSKDDAYIKARYDILVETEGTKTNVSNVEPTKKTEVQDTDAIKDSIEKARLGAIESIKNAWKKEV
jgi:hypothetical protein